MLKLYRNALFLFLMVSVQSSYCIAQTLYLDEQFGFTLTSGVIFASKPAGSPASNIDLALELYEPSGTGVPDNRPAIILIHGGGFTGGSRFSGRLIQMCERLAKRGYTCVSIDYRLYGDDPVVAPPFEPISVLFTELSMGDPRGDAVAASVEDGWAAYQWLAANSASLGIDTSRVGVGGSSAGAFTALHLGYSLDELGVAPSYTFSAVFDMWGALAAPSSYIQAGDTPLLITHGVNDQTVPVDAAYVLEMQAASINLAYESHILPGVGHGYDIFSVLVTPTETMFDRAVAFFYYYVAEANSAFKVPALGFEATLLMVAIIFTVAIGARRGFQ